MAVQRGRSQRRGESYFFTYGEPLSAARTKLADFFNILLDQPSLTEGSRPADAVLSTGLFLSGTTFCFSRGFHGGRMSALSATMSPFFVLRRLCRT